MDEIKRIEIIKKLGFTEYEAKCYLALFKKESLSVSEIVTIAGVPQANVYGTMEKLLVKGMCVLLPGKMKRFAAIDPTAFREKSLELINDTMSSLNSLSDELDDLYKTSRSNNTPLDYIEVLKEGPQCEKMFEQFIAESKKEVLILSKQRNNLYNDCYAGREGILDCQLKIGIDAIKRGVTTKCIYEITDNEETNRRMFEKVIDPFAEAGEQSRVKEELPIRIAVFDEEIAMFSLVDLHETISTVTTQIVRHPVMAKSFKIFFEAIWDKSEDYHEYKKRMGWI
jgi:sugar-specific transcriptional regulator TrmB